VDFKEFCDYSRSVVLDQVALLDGPDDDVFPFIIMWGYRDDDDPDEHALIVALLDPAFVSSRRGADELSAIVLPGAIVSNRAEHFAFVSQVLAQERHKDDPDESPPRPDDPETKRGLMMFAGSGDGSYYIGGSLLLNDGEQAPALGKWGEFIRETTGNIITDGKSVTVRGEQFDAAMMACVSVKIAAQLGDPEVEKMRKRFSEAFQVRESSIDMYDDDDEDDEGL
jgi:hypothetical protein